MSRALCSEDSALTLISEMMKMGSVRQVYEEGKAFHVFLLTTSEAAIQRIVLKELTARVHTAGFQEQPSRQYSKYN